MDIHDVVRAVCHLELLLVMQIFIRDRVDRYLGARRGAPRLASLGLRGGPGIASPTREGQFGVRERPDGFGISRRYNRHREQQGACQSPCPMRPMRVHDVSPPIAFLFPFFRRLPRRPIAGGFGNQLPNKFACFAQRLASGNFLRVAAFGGRSVARLNHRDAGQTIP